MIRSIAHGTPHIDRYQETYFVIADFAELFAATRPDFAPIYREIAALPEIPEDAVLPDDTIIESGNSRRYAGKKKGPQLSAARV